MTGSQWLAAAILLLVLGGLLFAFLRHGTKIKPDPDNKPPSDQGGQPNF